jgi:hypothetical protein
MSDEYFNPTEACPQSRTLLEHSTVTTVRCGPCKLLNPNYKEPAVKLSERRRATPGPRSEVIELDDSPGPQTITPARRRGLATQIPTIPNFKLGYTEKER